MGDGFRHETVLYMAFLSGYLRRALSGRRVHDAARCALILLNCLGAYAADFPWYEIRRAPAPPVIDGKLDDAAWRAARRADRFHFNWWTTGEKEKTEVRLLWDDDRLYVGFRCYDRHISAAVTERHGPVSRDDCVEVFISPNPGPPYRNDGPKRPNYYGFEMNVIGTMLNFIRADWWTGGRTWEPEGVEMRTSHHGPLRKVDSPEDRLWTLEIAIPFRNFARDAAHVPPVDGDVWRLNLNRAGGTTNAQYSTWSPVRTAKPNFHVPESFGYVRFRRR